MFILKNLIDKQVATASIIPINFAKPWWWIYWQQKGAIATVIAYILVDDGLLTLLPIGIGYMFVFKRIDFVLFLMVPLVIVEVVGWFSYHPCFNRLSAQTHDSFRYGAYKHLLAIDPLFHVQRSSGSIIGKVQRTSLAYADLTNTVLDDFIPVVVELSAVIISSLIIHRALGVLVAVSIISFVVPFCLVMMRSTSGIERASNKADDLANQLGAESLNQLPFIRATFTTDSIKTRLFNLHTTFVQKIMRLWTTYALVRGIFVVLFLVLFTVQLLYVLYLVRHSMLSATLATTFVLTYLRGTKGIFKLDQILKVTLTSYRRIKDFYAFERSFGKQTFPVYQEDKTVGQQPMLYRDATHIQFKEITFAYPPQEPIFDNNSFDLTVPRQEQNKLYGIIGPSGMGKTTFVSILGGQLKPQGGQVLINGIDIYGVGDNVRRQLIALQGQVATSLRGTLKYNLLFGLPDLAPYTDEELVKLLNSVGLWQIFEYKEGLGTLIGEGGLSLSGGQRQRLNFANLYLRARFYKPLLILIDEPTSSLDELSEKAITKMIDELAAESITFVVAHRLNTLEQAYKILDFSLLWSANTLIFYTPKELLEQSEYYRQLITGKERLDV